MSSSGPIRLIEAGATSALRSQTIYHGLAYARTPRTPDTVVLLTPAEPYVCIGFHQDLEREVDTAWCGDRGLPVLRRETGGGAVYLDSDQLFVQWVMAGESLPARVDRRFELFARPLVATYRDFGVAAEFRPVNDVHVDGRKIVGTGAAHIGEAEVLVGNLIFDFDTGVMTRVLRTPSEAFREQVRQSLDAYMTSIRRETGSSPDRGAVAAAYARHCATALGRDLEPGTLTAEEERAIDLVDQRFTSSEFRTRAGGRPWRGVKIHEDVHVAESVYGHPDGDVRITARLRRGFIDAVAFTRNDHGQFDGLQPLIDGLREIPLDHLAVSRVVRARHPAGDALTPGEVDGWVSAVLDLDPNREATR